MALGAGLQLLVAAARRVHRGNRYYYCIGVIITDALLLERMLLEPPQTHCNSFAGVLVVRVDVRVLHCAATAFRLSTSSS